MIQMRWLTPGIDADADGSTCVDWDETNGRESGCRGSLVRWCRPKLDGWSDYDMDMDGSEYVMYIDQQMVRQKPIWTVYDDVDGTLLALSTEADSTLCYSDDDGDGYG